MTRQFQNRYFHLLWQHLDVLIIMVLTVVYLVSTRTLLQHVLGWVFLFLPGYSVAKLVIQSWKGDFIFALTCVMVLSLCIGPLLGNLVQILTFLNSYSVLMALLTFSLPIMITSNFRIKSNYKEHLENVKESKVCVGIKSFLSRTAVFFGSLAVSVGLYLQTSLGAAVPRGFDIYGHMYLVNGLIDSGKAFFHPDLNVLSNFYHFFYAEICLLTGLDVSNAALVAQVLLGGILAMTVYYFAESVTGSSVASFFSVVLFIAGPPLYGNVTRYFNYFHPMWVAFAIFPFALAYVHGCISQQEGKSIGVASLIIMALFLYHLAVGLIFAAILLFDSLFLLKTRWKLLLSRLVKIAILTFSVSTIITVPFLLNISNPFKYVYTTGGFQTLYSMLFGVSRYAFASPQIGWEFFSKYLQEFMTLALPLIVVGIPALVFLFLRRKHSFALIFACVLVGVLGTVQPYLGIAFLPQRFTRPMILFGAVLAGLLISVVLVVPTFYIVKRGRAVRIKLGVSKKISNRPILMLVIFCYLLFSTYLIFYSPAQQAVLAAELYITHDDLTAIKWIDKNLPQNSRILMDQYLQFFFTGITGRPRLYTITADKPLYMIWDVYPVNVYIGRTEPLEVDVDYMVISRWCYTTWAFAGKQYFDQHGDLTRIYEHTFVYLNHTYTYAVYKLIR